MSFLQSIKRFFSGLTGNKQKNSTQQVEDEDYKKEGRDYMLLPPEEVDGLQRIRILENNEFQSIEFQFRTVTITEDEEENYVFEFTYNLDDSIKEVIDLEKFHSYIAKILHSMLLEGSFKWS